MTAIYDGLWPLKIEDNFIRNASNAEVEASLAAAFLPPGILQINFTALLVNTGRKLVLIDTGTAGQIVDSAGTLLDNLAVAGIKPAAIDTILISHFHPDHINGLKDRDGRKIFPNAEIAVPDAEWAYWMNEANMTGASPTVRKYFLNARRIFRDLASEVKRFTPGSEVAPGITAIAAPGHTPGHVAFAVASGNQSMLVLADTARNPELFVRHPEWQPSFDMDGLVAVGVAPAATRSGRRRQNAGARLSLPVPGDRPHRKSRDGLRARPGHVAAVVKFTRASSSEAAQERSALTSGAATCSTAGCGYGEIPAK